MNTNNGTGKLTTCQRAGCNNPLCKHAKEDPRGTTIPKDENYDHSTCQGFKPSVQREPKDELVFELGGAIEHYHSL
ncbi:MAG: hypothetical protein LBH47_03685 [Christensenellaceae bacterium]|jgi:hypothetical protein|nr:hypothetical protein [Christensenellaceae bacterium]